MKYFYSTLFLCGIALQSWASTSSSCLRQAQDYKVEGNHSAAINTLKACLVENGSDNELRVMLAELYFLNNRTAEATTEIDILKNNGALSEAAKMKFCIANFKRRNYKLAAEYGKGINTSQLSASENIEFLIAYGQSLYKQNLFLEAIEILEKAAAISPGNTDIWMSLGSSFSQIENHKRALVCMEKAVESDAKNPAKHILLAEAYYDAGERIKSLDAYRKAEEVGHKPDFVFYVNVANVFFDLKDYENVLVLTKKARELNPYSSDVAYLEAYAYYNMNKLSEAREIAEGMLKINPDNANAIYFIGMTYQKGSQMNKAEAYFEKAIAMKPELEKLRVSNFNWDGRKQ